MKYIVLLLLFFNILFAEITTINFKVKDSNFLLNNPIVDNVNIIDDFSTVTLENVLEIKTIPFYNFWKEKPIYTEKKIKYFQKQLKLYLESLGYYKSNIYMEEGLDAVEFIIEKNEPIKIKSIKIEDKYKNLISLEKGEIFNTLKFKESKKAIRRYFNKEGFLNAVIKSKAYINMEDYNVDIVFKISPQEKIYINNVIIENNADIDIELIKKEIKFKEGEPFNIEKTEKTFKNIYNYGIFENILIEPKNIENKNNLKDVLIKTKEGKNKYIKVSVGYDTDKLYNGAFTWGDNNFFGNLKKMKIGIKSSTIDKSIFNNIEIPYIKLPIIEDFDIVNEIKYKESVLDIYEETKIENKIYLRKNIFGIENHFGVLIEKDKIQNIAKDKEFDETEFFINSFFYKGILDKRDNKMLPINGFFYSFYLENANPILSSDIEYLKLISELRIMKTINDFTFYFKNRIGLVDQQIPLYKKFYSGGTFTNRGYDYLEIGEKNNGVSIGGISLNENTFEIAYQLNKSFDLALFLDSTQLSNEIYDFGDKYYNSYGIGVRYNTKIGPIRIDIARPIEDETVSYKLNLAIGLTF